MKKKRKLKKKFVVFFLLYFTFFSFFFIYKVFSKYSTDVNKTTTASIASWDVSANLPEGSYSIYPNDDQSFTISVTSNSDVGLTYSIVVSGMANNSLVSLDDSLYSKLGTSMTFSKDINNNNFVIGANDTNKTKTHTLKFITTTETTGFSGSNTSLNKNVTISVNFKQNKPR